MVVIPAGKFVMGSPADEQNRSKDEGPQHEVMIEKIFALGQYEVTRGEFAAFVRGSGHKQPNDCISFTKEGEIKNDANWMNPSYSQTDIHPVVCVSAEDADAYAHWLSQKTGKRYRLPTEAEWEYAERAGNQSLYPWGTDPDSACQYGNVLDQSVKQPLAKLHKKFNTQDSMLFNCNDQHVFTAPVGSYQANAFGLWDVSGNVLEWNCSAYTEGGYDGHEKSCTDDINTRLVRRGGSWLHEPNGVRSALRDGETPSFRHFVLGFRLAQDL